MKPQKKFFILTLLLILGIITNTLLGCTPSKSATNPSTDGAAEIEISPEIKAEALALQSKYSEYSDYDYSDKIETISPHEIFYIKSDIAYNDFEGEGNDKSAFKLFSDPLLKDNLFPYINYQKKGIIEISPPQAPMHPLKEGDRPEYVEDLNLYGMSTWGLFNTFYLAQYHDLQTGKRLEKPFVRIIKVVADDKLDAPIATASVKDNGFLNISWDPVEGATKYYVMKIKRDAVTMYAIVLNESSDTNWSNEERELKELKKYRDDATFDNYSSINTDFSSKYSYAFDDLDTTGVIDSELVGLSSIVIIAANQEKTSNFSNEIRYNEITPHLPFSLDTDALKKAISREDVSLTDLPDDFPIRMCDGSVKLFPAVINLEKTIQKENYLQLYFDIPETPYTFDLYVQSFDPNTFQTILSERNEAQKNRIRTGAMPSLFIEKNKKFSLINKKVSNTRPDVPDKIFATSALSEYLAANLIDGADIINVKQFPEAQDLDLLLDALYEASFQNPTAFAFKRLFYDNSDGGNLEIIYMEYDGLSKEQMQEEIRVKTKEVVSAIITPNMTDLEKATAINHYLCSNASYDYNAFDNIADWTRSDIAAAFNTYGILVNNLGVCISYAHAFNALAREAGLESIIVTGSIAGSTISGKHAWNRMKIDGEWKTIDVTWNDNEYTGVYTQYFNLKDNDPVMSERHILDSTDYLLDSQIPNYLAQ